MWVNVVLNLSCQEIFQSEENKGEISFMHTQKYASTFKLYAIVHQHLLCWTAKVLSSRISIKSYERKLTAKIKL